MLDNDKTAGENSTLNESASPLHTLPSLFILGLNIAVFTHECRGLIFKNPVDWLYPFEKIWLWLFNLNDFLQFSHFLKRNTSIQRQIRGCFSVWNSWAESNSLRIYFGKARRKERSLLYLWTLKLWSQYLGRLCVSESVLG